MVPPRREAPFEASLALGEPARLARQAPGLAGRGARSAAIETSGEQITRLPGASPAKNNHDFLGLPRILQGKTS